MNADAGAAEVISELGRAVAQARAELAAGRLIDMSLFQVRLEALCRRLEAQGAGARKHLALLAALRADLEALAEDVESVLTTLKAAAGEPAGTAGRAPP